MRTCFFTSRPYRTRDAPSSFRPQRFRSKGCCPQTVRADVEGGRADRVHGGQPARAARRVGTIAPGMRVYSGITALAAGVACALAAPAGAGAAGLTAGVGKADITPRTGYYLGGWTRADRTAHGQHTRLFSRAMVLERNGRKVALAQVDLFMIPGGMVQHVGERLADIGLSERSILLSASHTHSGPGGYGNFPTLNTAAPSLETATDPFSFARLLNPQPADPRLYRFLTDQIATPIRRAERDRRPGGPGRGCTRLLRPAANP